MIAIIPARGGSKGLPGKNIMPLCGKPLIAYTIEAALKSNCIDNVFVNTDSPEIAEVAKQYGAEVPFLRPSFLASDTASAIDVYIHAANWISKNSNLSSQNFMVLLPTAPLRTNTHIDDAFLLYQEKTATTLVAVKEAETPPSWYMSVDDNARLTSCRFDGGDRGSNRQASNKFYIPCGAIYILNKKLLETQRTYYSANTVAYIMDNRSSVDIDTYQDFKMAEFLLKNC